MITLSATDLDAWVAALIYPFFRMLALCSSAPVLSHASVPTQIRVALSLLLTMVIAPTLPALGPLSPFSATGLVLLIQQILIGVALGLVMQIAFAAVQLAGDMIGLQMGLSFASFIDPQNSQETPIVGGFLSLILMLVFLSINGHLMLLAGLVQSFDIFPIAADSFRWQDWHRLATAGGQLFTFGLQIAFPVIAAMMLTNLALGVLTRTAPQLNVFAIGFPVTLIVGLLMMVLTLPYEIPALERVVQTGLAMFVR